jgi:hypothetical protein
MEAAAATVATTTAVTAASTTPSCICQVWRARHHRRREREPNGNHALDHHNPPCPRIPWPATGIVRLAKKGEGFL